MFSITTCSTNWVFIPSCNSFNLSHKAPASIKSIGNAPCLVASFLASGVNVPVVINIRLSVLHFCRAYEFSRPVELDKTLLGANFFKTVRFGSIF